MPDPALLERIDRIMAELAEVRAELVASEADETKGAYTIPSLGDDLIEISTAAHRFNRPADTLRFWCRHEGCGRRSAAAGWRASRTSSAG